MDFLMLCTKKKIVKSLGQLAVKIKKERKDFLNHLKKLTFKRTLRQVFIRI
jgi:hypothetical protein